MKKRCHECKRVLDDSSFNGSSKEPDGLAKKCRSCVNRRRRKLQAMKSSKTAHQKPPHLAALVKRGDYAAIKRNRRMINPSNRATLLELAVRDFRSRETIIWSKC